MILSKNRATGLILGVAMGTTSAMAGEAMVSYDGTCLAPIAAYKDGLPVLEQAEGVSTQQHMVKTTEMFREVLGAFAEVQTCHQNLMEKDGADEQFATLYSGTRETSRVFTLVQSQFETAIEEMSAAALSEVEPAAGADAEANLAAEEQTLGTMEILMDSYMVLERSQEFGRSLLKVTG